MGAARYKPYPAYKPSGVEWLGDIPEGWEAKRLGNLFEERREKVSDKDYPPLSVTMQGIVPQLETAAKSLDSDNRKLVKAGDFVINSRSDRKGSAGLSALDGSVTLISNVLKPRGIEGSFAHHLLKSYPFQEEYYRFGKGIVADLWSTNFNSMKNIPLPVVPKEEQTKIAAFLDYETGKIDALIAKQERLIDLLEEKRQAVISHAVTKGLNPDAPLCPSGVDWLGDVPEHWDVKKLHYLLRASPKNGVSPEVSDSGKTPTFSTAAVRNGVVDISNHLKSTAMNVSAARPYFVNKDDILVLRGSGSKDLVGTAGTVTQRPPENCIYPDILIRIQPNTESAPNFIVFCLNSTRLRPQVEDAARTAAGIWKISGSSLKSLIFPVPPLGEQNEIVEFIRDQSRSFDLLESRAKEATNLLVERRTALISAAVTGKIDVRDWLPPQPLSDTDLSTEDLQEAAL